MKEEGIKVSARPKLVLSGLYSYLSDRYFRVEQEDDSEKIGAGVLQASILGPILYLLHTSDLSTVENYQTATLADDTAILAVGNTAEESTQKLQIGIGKICACTTL